MSLSTENLRGIFKPLNPPPTQLTAMAESRLSDRCNRLNYIVGGWSGVQSRQSGTIVEWTRYLWYPVDLLLNKQNNNKYEAEQFDPNFSFIYLLVEFK